MSEAHRHQQLAAGQPRNNPADTTGVGVPSKNPGAGLPGEKPGAGGRLFSLDVYRGLVMTLLIAEGAGVYSAMRGLSVDWLDPIAAQFFHPAYEGFTFWDLIQPAFMFIVGVSMVFSMRKRAKQGQSWGVRFRHILIRCVILFMMGTGLHCVYAGALVWELWNVLTQLSVTIMIAFLMMELPILGQFLISLALIGVTDLAYRFIQVEPYDQVYAAGANFGTYMDTWLMNTVNSDHWVAVNCIPTAAHTIWGVLAGQVLIGSGGASRKALKLAAWGLAALVVGYGLYWLGYAPMIKRICTVPYVVAAGGWCVLALALFYWVIDGLGFKRGGWVVAVVGTNSILIYLVTESLAHAWLNPKVGVFVVGGLSKVGVSEATATLVNALVVWALLWGLCYWLYVKRAFVKI